MNFRQEACGFVPRCNMLRYTLAILTFVTGCYTRTIVIPGTLDLRAPTAPTPAPVMLSSQNTGIDAVIDGAGTQAVSTDRFAIESRAWWALGFFPTHSESLTAQISDVLAVSDVTNLTISEEIVGTDAALFALSKSIVPLCFGTFWMTPTFTVTVDGTRTARSTP
jgi:hypothetical protein